MDCGDCLGEKSGGVAGAGVYVSPLVVRLPVLRSRLRGRLAVMEVNDCEKENTCRPSMCVKNSGKK